MSKRETILRYNNIIKKLRKKEATFKEISEGLAFESELLGYKLTVSKRTFQRDLEDIRSIYNIDVQFDFSRKVYFIDYEEKPGLGERILEAFDTLNALNINNNLVDCIQFEKQQPKGTENFHLLLHSIKNHFQIEFSHQKYWDQQATQRLLEPYFLKEFKSRWYLVGRETNNNQIKSFGLDRISSVNVLKTKFSVLDKPCISSYFQNSFGIVGPNSAAPSVVVLSFSAFQGKFIKALPLHSSQQIILDNAAELQIKLKLFITYDFIMEILSHGDNVRVVKPLRLVNVVKTVYKNTLAKY